MANMDADKPDMMSSDEEGFVSSESTASMEFESDTKRNLTLALGKLRLEQEDVNRSSCQGATPSTSRPEGRSQTHSDLKMPKKPRLLLDLPLDVLKEIIKEVTHTNDLTSLALTCSALHGLAIPHMYSRFDIVWPESLNSTTTDYSGVDALSYGLSTLVMGEDVFSRLPTLPNGTSGSCKHCGCDFQCRRSSLHSDNQVGGRSRRGNHYAQYTRTFSIGNGPLSWVQEYSVTKEVGKMLGTLVALAVTRMVNLEAFVWDMPTGVVREIWLALASLADQPGHECRLERIWVRWHDNSENALRILSAPTTRTFQKYKHVEHPSLSVLPPLKSVAVLDIDEPAYVEELALLIEKSRQRLTELRIGIAGKAHMSTWLLCGTNSDYPSSWPRADGILGILKRRSSLGHNDEDISASPIMASMPPEVSTDVTPKRSTAAEIEELASPIGHPVTSINKEKKQPHDLNLPSRTSHSPANSFQADSDMLSLNLLELERVPLHVPTLLPAVDWTKLNTLTIMQCVDHEKLWRALRRKYAPPAAPAKRPSNSDTRFPESQPDFPLNLKHIRTDNVSPYLILFIKDALAPNTLESVFLHEAPAHESSVQIDAIYRHILRKHRKSLRRVLIDGTDRQIGSGYSSTRWYKWMLTNDMISFVTSGKMPQLKELGMAMNYADWHFFLQRLPNMPQLRALYLPNIFNTVHRDLKELALQVLDIVSIRPDLKIAYLGLHIKCFQILEARHDDNPADFDDNPTVDFSPPNTEDEEDQNPSTVGTNVTEHHNDDDEDDDESFNGDVLSSNPDDYDTDPDEDQNTSRIHYRLQEILFYDEKVSIFKARHGVL
ncbi:uncharacterized protein N7511_005485 [Penicillium nucicola]|uniref:uncharacterized protein n=1 Tax=Penicillium nucicola TaxID=1850975 RepID=UPI002545150F|nr:uncharacterized protein N7511_005485 [Penicillium nucicola]KAJ5762103.1 hypothetical protein N7511_005485 [Penicillium nucicola]